MSEEKEFLDKVKEEYAKIAHTKDLKVEKICSSCGKKDVTLIWVHESSWICFECYQKQKKTPQTMRLPRNKAGTFHSPEHFKWIQKTRIEYGFVLKTLKFHDYMTGSQYNLSEFLEYLPELPANERFMVSTFLKKEGLLEE